MTTEPQLHSADVPQEDNLQDVRSAVQAIADGLHDTQSIADRTKRSRRHVGYAINGAIVLGWVEDTDEGLGVTELGKNLLSKAAGSPDERAVLRESVEKSPSLKAIAPDLLAEAEPARAVIAERIVQLAELAKSTADRRAHTLLSWRRQILSR